jgi:ubiquinone/menaquinone biosynthesis C-methylase UbiE
MKYMKKNIDYKVVNDFGKEWTKFNQSNILSDELLKIFNQYFALFRWDKLPENPKGFDLGCGSGRWAFFCAPKVGQLHCIDPSETALQVTKKNLSEFDNCFYYVASVDNIPLDDNSMDFGYSLGVLHHVPDTTGGIKSCVKLLKSGAPFLLYLYYAFDNKPLWFKMLWQISDVLRQIISRLTHPMKYTASQIIAVLIYFPFSLTARTFERFGFDVSSFPLSAYRNKSLYTMRTDALDRFGTRLEQRFTKEQIKNMMLEVGLEKIEFSNEIYWCAIGYKK